MTPSSSEPATPATAATAATPATPASAGADRAGDADVILRAAHARDLDRRALRIAKRTAQWIVLLCVAATPVACFVVLPTRVVSQCRSKQSETKGNLKALYVAEESYRAEFGRYTDDRRAMGFEPRGARLRYEYFVKVNDGRDEQGATAPAFEGYAVGVAENVNGDVWRITHNNDLVNLENACAR